MPDKQYFDELAARWDSIRQQDGEILQYLVSLIGLKQEDTVLDVGCGTGVLFDYILSAIGNGQLHAVDYSSAMISIAGGKYSHYTNISYYNDDIMNLIFKEKFDEITCLNFFPHVDDKQLFLQHMRRMLKIGAKLVIMHDISRDTVNAIHVQSGDAIRHDRLPPVDTVSQWMRSNGFDIECALENDKYYFIKGQKY